jgi:GxxExxY protein
MAMDVPSDAVNQDARIVVDACLQIHRAIGPGYVESVYGHALALELRRRDVPFVREARTMVSYRGVVVGEHFIDFLVRDHLIVELKAVERLAPVHTAQVISYLRATGLSLALLINFNAPLVRDGVKRIIWTKPRAEWSAAD